MTSFAGTSNSMHDLAFDGANLWVADATNENARICKLSASGSVLSSFTSPGDHPYGLTFNGPYWYVFDQVMQKIYRINPAAVNYFSKPALNADYLTTQGSYYWVVDKSAYLVYKLDQSGTKLTDFQSPSTQPAGIVYDGTNLWVLSGYGYTFDKLYKLNLSGTVISSYQSWEGLPEPYGLAYDGSHFWYIGKPAFQQVFKMYKLKIQ